jgi:hypothetical protein
MFIFTLVGSLLFRLLIGSVVFRSLTVFNMMLKVSVLVVGLCVGAVLSGEIKIWLSAWRILATMGMFVGRLRVEVEEEEMLEKARACLS